MIFHHIKDLYMYLFPITMPLNKQFSSNGLFTKYVYATYYEIQKRRALFFSLYSLSKHGMKVKVVIRVFHNHTNLSRNYLVPKFDSFNFYRVKLICQCRIQGYTWQGSSKVYDVGSVNNL